jgi:MinD superfamily P-loop ATPase
MNHEIAIKIKRRALGYLVEEKLDESLVRLRLLAEEKMVGSLVRLDLNHAEEKNSPQFGSPKFPLQLISKG